jgi:iron complex transport system substrate-binding protein
LRRHVFGSYSTQCTGPHYHSEGRTDQLRIVSLLASATEIVCALGTGSMLVGRSHECDNPEWVRRLPACSEPAFDVSVSSAAIDAEVRRRIATGEELYRVHGDLIRNLCPDLVIAQEHCEVCAVSPRDVERSGTESGTECLPMLVLSASSVEGILAGIHQVGERIGLRERAIAVVAREQARLNNVFERTADLPRPSLVMLEWTDPLFAMGNWSPELVEIAHGELLIGKKGDYSAPMPAQQLIDADPEVIIVAPCGFGLQRAWKERRVLRQNVWWPRLRAVRNGKVAFADGNLFFNRSGMTISQTTAIIAEILHGVTSGAPTQGVHWRWDEA